MSIYILYLLILGVKMSEFKKVVNPGNTDYGNVFCKILFDGEKLSISGVEGPLYNGNCKGACGQIVDSVKSITELAEGWTPDLVMEFVSIWKRWHLNDMKAGNHEQERALREMQVALFKKYDTDSLSQIAREEGKKDYYELACEYLKEKGLYESHGYRYGTAWCREDVPEEVIAFLIALPDSTKEPAWV